MYTIWISLIINSEKSRKRRRGVREKLIDFGEGRGIPDTIWFGLVQGFEDEWGYFSQADIESLKPRTWEIKKVDLPYSGRR